MDDVLSRASDIHAIGYFGVLTAVLLVECVIPRRRPAGTLAVRWFGNVVLAVLGIVLVRATLPVAGLALSILCVERGWGVFNVATLSAPAAFLVTILLLDLAIYAQHYMLHRVGFLWRLHRAHHTDPEFDLTTGLRFHPFEAVFSTSVTLLVILVLGAPPLAVLAWQVLSTAHNLLEHANVRIPAGIDRAVRLLLVTPDMHRIHHSAVPAESRANFANIFSFWDRLFGTYIAQPTAGHDRMVFGLKGFTHSKHLKVHWLLAQPFLADPGASASLPPPETTPSPRVGMSGAKL
jgi:sterol desaturase/sphingolipid hydroxylase (fatty acid hydroxylase superfamily)